MKCSIEIKYSIRIEPFFSDSERSRERERERSGYCNVLICFTKNEEAKSVAKQTAASPSLLSS